MRRQSCPASVALRAFPQTILPNKLLKELRALAGAAEQAAFVRGRVGCQSIFMGALSETYLRAAQAAARLLSGSLYERYYGLPFAQVLTFEAKLSEHGVSTSPRTCDAVPDARAQRRPGSYVARNGNRDRTSSDSDKTHNLATLFEDAAFATPTGRSGLGLGWAKRCFQWICSRLQMPGRRSSQMQLMKNAAYAWAAR